jgi:hypothetical protein
MPQKNNSYMTIEPAPPKPKTFTDQNLERGYGEGGANNVTTKGAKPGGTIGPIQRSIKIPRTNPMRHA